MPETRVLAAQLQTEQIMKDDLDADHAATSENDANRHTLASSDASNREPFVFGPPHSRIVEGVPLPGLPLWIE